jgi:MarR family 2-MHQ and catechol resistance regulon transcriptional repressor
MRDADSPLRSEIKQNKPFRSPGEEAAVALMRTSDVLHRRLADVIEPHGITHQQYNVLRILRGSAPEPLPTLEIASRMIEQAPGITRLLDRLEAKSLVRRERCKEDRRQVHCWITAAGLELLGRLDAPILQATREGFKPLSRETTRVLVDLLDRVRAGFRATAV